MIAGYRSAIAAWYVAGSLLLQCCCRCYSFSFGNHALPSRTTATSTKNIDVGCLHRRRRHGRPWSSSSPRQAPSVRRVRTPVGVVGGDGVGEVAGAAAEAAGAALVLPRPIVRVVLPEGRGLRVHSMSDLHTDSSANAAWVKTWESWKGYDSGEPGEAHEDILIVAGDISSSLERAAETLTDLKERYDEVFFVVGNHEMWTGGRRAKAKGSGGEGEPEGISSVDKLVQLHRMCESLGVRTDPVIFVVGGGGAGVARGEGVLVEEERVSGERSAEEGLVVRGRQELAVFPLLSWYHASWDSEPNLPPELQLRRGNFLRRWRDYSCCHWPEDLCSREDFVTLDRDAPPVMAEFFARQNNACIETFRSKGGDAAETRRGGKDGGGNNRRSFGGGGGGSTKVISFSHFVPRQELCPEKRLLWEPQLTKVIGSDPLERQIRQLGSDVHIFGHTHIPIDMTSDGVRYVQWPLGSLREQSYRTNDMREKGPLLVYSHDGREGGLRPPVHTLWGEFYETFPRDPRDTDIPENSYEYMKQRIADGRRRARASSASQQQPDPLV